MNVECEKIYHFKLSFTAAEYAKIIDLTNDLAEDYPHDHLIRQLFDRLIAEGRFR